MEIFDQLAPFFKNIWVQIALLVIFATGHGYVGAWLAVRMLFRPRRPVKLLGVTVFPQGMIPRHRERLAMAIGKAVGEELVSHDTIVQQLTGGDFLRTKIDAVVSAYTNELLEQEHPSFIEALPENLRAPVLDAVDGLKTRLGEHINSVLQSPDSHAAIRSFVTRRVDEILGKRVSDIVDDDAFEAVIAFVDGRVRSAVEAPAFEATIRDFVSKRLRDLLNSETPIGQMFTPESIELLKEKANEQIGPAIHHLAEFAATDRTRDQIGALIKREVHGYYENLSFFKKIFVSREMLLREVDDLVSESLPARIEEALKGTFFAEEAQTFISAGIDNAMAKPLPVVIGAVASDQLERLEGQVSRFVLKLVRNDETIAGISSYMRATLQKLRPHSLDAILQTLYPESEEKLKTRLADMMLSVIKSEDTSRYINELIAAQIDGLLSRPIGHVGALLPEDKVRAAAGSLTDAIISTLHAKIPAAVAEFDVAGMVREKIKNYPPEKLESLVMSVAKEHLRTIELFGAVFGFLIGLVQAVQFYLYAH